AEMFAGSLGPDDRVRAAQLKMSTRSTIAITKHVEDRNTASEVLGRRLSIAACHVQHSVQTVRVAREIQISGGVSGFGGYALKLPVTILEFILFQIGFGGNQP